MRKFTREWVGDWLRKKRTKASLTQFELAVSTGISQPKISKVENGTLELSIWDMSQILKVLELEWGDFDAARNTTRPAS